MTNFMLDAKITTTQLKRLLVSGEYEETPVMQYL